MRKRFDPEAEMEVLRQEYVWLRAFVQKLATDLEHTVVPSGLAAARRQGLVERAQVARARLAEGQSTDPQQATPIAAQPLQVPPSLPAPVPAPALAAAFALQPGAFAAAPSDAAALQLPTVSIQAEPRPSESAEHSSAREYWELDIALSDEEVQKDFLEGSAGLELAMGS